MSDNEEIETSGQATAAAIGCALAAMITFCVAGNVLVVLAIVTDRRLRTPSNYFYVSLALADTLVAALVMTLALVNDLAGRWLFGGVLCNVWLSADVMGSTASILHLSAISLDRLVNKRIDSWVIANMNYNHQHIL